jgi:HlyD family secretion protein
MKRTPPAEDSDLDNTIESLMMKHSGKQPFIYWVVLLGLVAAIVALPIVKIQISVSAPGIITSKSERIAIVSPVDGYVKENLASDNLSVLNGGTLIVLESNVLSEKIGLNSAQHAEIEKELADIDMLLKTIEKIAADKTQSLNTDIIGVFKTAKYLGQYELLRTQLLNNDVQFARNDRENNRVRVLHAQGLTSDRDLDEAKYAVDLIKAERQQLIHGSKSSLRSNQLSLQNALTQSMGEAAQLSKQADYYTIKAPATGVLMGFNNLSLGTYISAGTRIGEVSPHEDLLVEAYVEPRDIGFVRIGQKVYMQVDSFPYTEWGALVGNVVAISPDIIKIGQASVFKVVMNMTDTTLESAALGKVNVGKGMTLRIQFLMQQRTLLQLLYQKTSETFDPRTHGD